MGNNALKLIENDCDVSCFSDDEIRNLAECFFETYGQQFIKTLEEEGVSFNSLDRKTHNYPKKDFNWDETKWGRMLRDTSILDINSIEGKRFRRRFRMPATFFLQFFVPLIIEKKIFGNTKRRHYIPIEIKCLIVLRRLGRGETFDTIAELSDVNEESCRVICSMFIYNFAVKLKNDYIKFPKVNSQSMMETMSVYAYLGLPGAIGSMDCTHIKWNKCPQRLQKLCRGGKGYPTIAFEAVCDHAGKILHVSRGFYGSSNDKFIEQIDTLPLRFDHGEFKNVTFQMYDEANEIINVKGLWLIVDGGYRKRTWAIDPMHDRVGWDEVLWSEWLESVRKDIERVFGILKGRFRVLHTGVEVHSATTIEAMFTTCCILHNMLLEWDGLSTNAWNVNVDWLVLEPIHNFDENEDADALEQDMNEIAEIPRYDPSNTVDDLRNGTFVLDQILMQPSRRVRRGIEFHPIYGYDKFRDALVKHFKKQYNMGNVKWPRCMTKESRERIPILPRPSTHCAIIRAVAASSNDILIKQSEYVFDYIDNRNRTYQKSPGKGLFALKHFKKDEIVAYYVGEYITPQEYDIRDREGRGGYAVYISQQWTLDSYNFLDLKFRLDFIYY